MTKQTKTKKDISPISTLSQSCLSLLFHFIFLSIIPSYIQSSKSFPFHIQRLYLIKFVCSLCYKVALLYVCHMEFFFDSLLAYMCFVFFFFLFLIHWRTHNSEGKVYFYINHSVSCLLLSIYNSEMLDCEFWECCNCCFSVLVLRCRGCNCRPPTLFQPDQNTAMKNILIFNFLDPVTSASWVPYCNLL